MARKKKKSTVNIHPMAWVIIFLVGGFLLYGVSRQGTPVVQKKVFSKQAKAPVKQAASAKKTAAPKSSSAGSKTPSLNAQLAKAAKAGDMKQVKDLVQQGADANVAIHKAIRADQYKVVKYLVRNGVEVEAADKASPLLLASVRSNRKIMKYLIGKGANVNARNSKGQTALLAVLASKAPDSYAKAELLVNKGADLDTKDRAGNTVFSLAKKSGDKKLMNLFSVGEGK